MQSFTKTDLWQRTLAARSEDGEAVAREVLRTSYMQMRDAAAELTSQIRAACPGLTIHDISHLDALWEMADLICGPKFPVNPAEAFVFGGAVLLHDAAMSAAAFQGGMDEITKLVEWQDAAAEIAAIHLTKNPEDISLERAEKDIKDAVVFRVLRHLHAEQAQRLLDLKFKRPDVDEEFRLLQNASLLDAFGHSIGIIASSHHWNPHEISEKLEQKVGAAQGIPSQWSVNEAKLALMLRSADASHIDARRAPSLAYAIAQPKGISKSHWKFQNKLNQAAVLDSKLVYTSGTPFKAGDSDAWWLAFDTCRMIDKEIRDCNAILSDNKWDEFEIKGVIGVESPIIFSKKVRVTGWKPVDAEVRVSDPVRLAETLGGQNLYGSSKIAPIRELIQNSADAIRARRKKQQNCSESFGKILIHFKKGKSNKINRLEVIDNGIGMSERVLTGPLIDFGSSFWKSELVAQEFPGIRSTDFKPIGKFGIGFFSIFLLGESVKVASRRYDAGHSEAKVLEFAQLSKRPLLREANKDEISPDFCTSVSVETEKNFEYGSELVAQVRSMVSALDIDVECYIDSELVWSHCWNWLHGPAEEFLSDVFSNDKDLAQKLVENFAKNTRLLEKDGTVYGRAVFVHSMGSNAGKILISNNGICAPFNGSSTYSYFQESGIFTGMERSGTVGVLYGETDDVSRKSVKADVPREAIALWATEQASLLDKDNIATPQLVQIARTLLNLGADTAELPVVFIGGKFQSLDKFKTIIENNENVIIPLDNPYETKLNIVPFSECGPEYFLFSPNDNVLIFNMANRYTEVINRRGADSVFEGNDLVSDDDLQGVLTALVPPWAKNLFELAWGSDLECRIKRIEMFSDKSIGSPQKRWGAVIAKARIS